MATFAQTPIPSPGSSCRMRPRILKAQFGGGYAQRTGDGPTGNELRDWDLVWENISRAQWKTMDDFLKARGGKEKFQWVQLIPFDGEGALWFVCEEWRGTYLGGDTHRFIATFIQEPAL